MEVLDKEEVFKKLNVYGLTPIHSVGGMLFKRDDLYLPFKDIPLSGGKVRQAISLVYENYDYIKNECNGTLYTSCSVSSPQGIIVSRVAREFGFKSTLFVGLVTPKSISKNRLLCNVLKTGGLINYETRAGYDNVLTHTINKKRDLGEKFFHVKFGINLENNTKSILDSIGYQVQNIPKDLDYLIIPCGSCITMGGVIRGLMDYGIKPKKVVGIQISGLDNKIHVLENIMGERPYEYDLRISKDYAYSKHLNMSFGSLQLDPLYEAKAMDYLLRYMADDIKGKKVCFWLVGNSSAVRNSIY